MGSARILVAEDEVLTGLALKSCLEGFGYDVPDVVASGEEAVEKSRALEADLVVMDIHLDGAMTGIEAAAMIKRSSRVPVVYLTAYSDEETLGQAKITEPFGYILKPFEEKTLQATLEMALYKSRAQNELQDTKERLSTVLESIGDAILVTDVNGAINYANKRASVLLYLPVPLPPFSSIFPYLRASDGVTGNDLSFHLKEVVSKGRSVRLAHSVLAVGQGQARTVDIALEPYRDSPSSVRGTIFVLRDTTESAAIEDFIVRELRSAANMHRSLLPPSQMETDRIRMSAFLMAAGFVAGDLYDFFPLDAAHVGFYLIDVAGHGVAASSLALLLSRLLSPGREGDSASGVLGVDPLSPRKVVTRLNEIFTRGRGQMFFTICYAVIDLARMELKLVRAGHTYPILLKHDGSLKEICGGGMAVGLSAAFNVEECETRLGPGDRLFMYSDGLTECEDEKSQQFSNKRLLDLLLETRHESLSESVLHVRKDLVTWRGKESFSDDVSLIAIEAKTR